MIIGKKQFNNSTIQQFNNSTIQQFNNSTIQQFNNSTIQHLNNSTTKQYYKQYCLLKNRYLCDLLVYESFRTRLLIIGLSIKVKFLILNQ